MATEVLRPQDVLTERIRGPSASPSVFPRRRNFNYNYNSNSSARVNRIAKPPAVQRKRPVNPPSPSPSPVPRRSGPEEVRSGKGGGGGAYLMMGQVTILRRGELLEGKSETTTPVKKAAETMNGPDPVLESSPKTPVYAGSAFFASPDPDSLPLPSFSKKKQMDLMIDDSATRDLRRLLRLD